MAALYKDGSALQASWSNGTTPVPVALSDTAPGIAQGVGGNSAIAPMRVGGRRIVIIPSRLADGGQSTGDIPPNEPVVLVVDLVAVR